MLIDRYRRLIKSVCFATLLCCCINVSFAQSRDSRFLTPSDTLIKNRLYLVAGSWTAIYGTALVGLDYAWYQQYERVPFHSFNDWPEWNQMDKAGHVWTAYMETRWTAQALKWSGVKPSVADAAAAGTGLLFQTTLEMLDAGSAKWGFSWSDMGANVVGTALHFAQEKFWQEQRIAVKFSFHPVDYSRRLPTSYNKNIHQRVDNLFGETLIEKTLKDYNGQTYWISVNPHSFADAFKPTWLNIAVGYGSHRMLGGVRNKWLTNGTSHDYTFIEREREFYLSPDIDFTKIPTKSPVLKTMFELLNVVKFPAPALMMNDRGKVTFQPLYF